MTEKGPESSTVRVSPTVFDKTVRVFNVPVTGPVHGAFSFTSHAKDIIPQPQESVMTQPVNQ